MADLFGDKEFTFLKSLQEHKVNFMIVGLSAATLQGAPVVTQDIDLWFENRQDPNLKRALKSVGAAYVPQIGLNPPAIAGGAAEMFDVVSSMNGLGSFSEELKNTSFIEIKGLKVRILNLDRIIVSKEAANRPKDKLVLPILRDVWATLKSRNRYNDTMT